MSRGASAEFCAVCFLTNQTKNLGGNPATFEILGLTNS